MLETVCMYRSAQNTSIIIINIIITRKTRQGKVEMLEGKFALNPLKYYCYICFDKLITLNYWYICKLDNWMQSYYILNLIDCGTCIKCLTHWLRQMQYDITLHCMSWYTVTATILTSLSDMMFSPAVLAMYPFKHWADSTFWT